MLETVPDSDSAPEGAAIFVGNRVRIKYLLSLEKLEEFRIKYLLSLEKLEEFRIL